MVLEPSREHCLHCRNISSSSIISSPIFAAEIQMLSNNITYFIYFLNNCLKMESHAFNLSTVGVRGRITRAFAMKQRCASVSLTDMSCARWKVPDLRERTAKYKHSAVDYFFKNRKWSDICFFHIQLIHTKHGQVMLRFLCLVFYQHFNLNRVKCHHRCKI